MGRANAFVSMCQRASREDWCWKIFCGTCRHAYFRCGFLEIAEGKHPEDSGWLSGKEHHHEMFHTLFDRSERALRDPEVQRPLSSIMAEAAVEQIEASCKFPDWLGYLGLGLFHTEHVERTDHVLTNAWTAQLETVLSEKAAVRITLENFRDASHPILHWRDLEMVEMDLRRRQGT